MTISIIALVPQSCKFCAKVCMHNIFSLGVHAIDDNNLILNRLNPIFLCQEKK